MQNLEAVKQAHTRIKECINRTPVITSSTLNKICSHSIYFKCENFQKVGAFKARGACNAVLQLDDIASTGVVTHSSGNHAAALSYAARIKNIPAYIVMPNNAPQVKIDAVKEYGGVITFCESNIIARETTAEGIRGETGASLIHPFDNDHIIAGAGTAALEFFEEVPDLDYILAPVGGGGLISGTAITAKGLNPNVKVIACEPANVDDAYQSFTSGEIKPATGKDTLADGLRTGLSDRTFAVIKEHVDDVITVSEEEIVMAMKMVWERMKIIIEPSSAVAVAPLILSKLDVKNKKIGVIISGGNVDLNNLPFK
jgi:threonine dehydratase